MDVLCSDFYYVVATAQWIPTTPETQSLIMNCLGKNEWYFEFDYFTPGGYSRVKKYCQFDSLACVLICNFVLGKFDFTPLFF